jgi:hypothetical protein
MFLGPGIAYAQGLDHKRHRKILTPAFGAAEMRALLPAFREVVQRVCRMLWIAWFLIGVLTCILCFQMVTLWREHIESTGKTNEVMDVSSWLSRATLDIIGEVAFDYRVGFAMQLSFRNLFAEHAHSSLVRHATGLEQQTCKSLQQLPVRELHILAH